jgi:hypothetical protein
MPPREKFVCAARAGNSLLATPHPTGDNKASLRTFYNAFENHRQKPTGGASMPLRLFLKTLLFTLMCGSAYNAEAQTVPPPSCATSSRAANRSTATSASRCSKPRAAPRDKIRRRSFPLTSADSTQRSSLRWQPKF